MTMINPRRSNIRENPTGDLRETAAAIYTANTVIGTCTVDTSI